MSLAVEATASNKSGSTAYTRRVPEDIVLYGVVSNELPTFLSHAEQSGRSVPAFVERELSRYLECGILAYGSVRVRCAACRYDRVVAKEEDFSRLAAAVAWPTRRRSSWIACYR
jgi:hypothetical protein